MAARVIRWCKALAGLVALVVGQQACGGDSADAGAGAAGSTATGGATSTAGRANGSSGMSHAGANANPAGGGSGGGKASGGAGNASEGGRSGGDAGRSGDGGSSSGGGGSSGSGSAVKSAGCGKTAPLAEAAQQSVTVGADARGYFLVPPTGYDSKTAYPLVFAYHGAGGNGAGLRGYLGLEAASKGQAIFVYPDGLGGIWDLQDNGPDAKLFDSVLATLQDGWCIDTGSVFAAGFSYGGWAATQIGKARATVVRGVASIEGGGPQGGGSNGAPVAAIIVHGTNDGAEPLASGESSRDHFRATNGCGASSSDVDPAPCKTYAGCLPGKAVEWCQHEGGHEVPAFAPAGIWSFFTSLRE